MHSNILKIANQATLQIVLMEHEALGLGNKYLSL